MLSFLKQRNNNTDSASTSRMRWLLIIGGAFLGVFLLLYGGGAFQSTEENAPAENSYSPTEDTLAQYQAYLEARIRTLCQSVDGVENVSVFVSFSQSFESVYATEQTEHGEEYVILGSGASASALLLTQSPPKIDGIGIVCTGGGNAAVRRELTSLLSATFRLPSNRIYITEG